MHRSSLNSRSQLYDPIGLALVSPPCCHHSLLPLLALDGGARVEPTGFSLNVLIVARVRAAISRFFGKLSRCLGRPCMMPLGVSCHVVLDGLWHLLLGASGSFKYVVASETRPDCLTARD